MIQQDKLNHLFWGAVIAFSMIFVMLMTGSYVPLIPTLAGSLLGAGKELVYDKHMKRGTPEFLDFVATFLGAFFIEFIVYLFLY